MSNFICNKCGTIIQHTLEGWFFTECIHYPLSTLNSGELTPKEIKKIRTKPPCSPLQKIAQKENYGLFTLLSMKSHLSHVKKVDCMKDKVEEINQVERLLTHLTKHIYNTQHQRREGK